MYGRSTRNFPRDVTPGPPPRGASLGGALEAQTLRGTPGAVAERVDDRMVAIRRCLWKLPEPWTRRRVHRSLENAQHAFSTPSTKYPLLSLRKREARQRYKDAETR